MEHGTEERRQRQLDETIPQYFRRNKDGNGYNGLFTGDYEEEDPQKHTSGSTEIFEDRKSEGRRQSTGYQRPGHHSNGKRQWRWIGVSGGENAR